MPRLLGILLLIGLAFSVADMSWTLASDPATVKSELLKELIQDLGSSNFRLRERASQEIWKLGILARPSLERAVTHPDLEVRRRAGEILDKFNWGVFPDTPPEILKLIREFRTGEVEKQTRVLDGLLAQGDRGLETVALLMARDFDTDRSSALFSHYIKLARRAVPQAILDGHLARAERILETAALGGAESGWSDYALFMLLNNKLPMAIDHLEATRKQPGNRGQSAGYALIWANHLAGKSVDALRVAEAYPSEPTLFDLKVSVQEDAGFWKSLADETGERTEGLSLHRMRKAGRIDIAKRITQAMLTEGRQSQNSEVVQQLAVGLLLNRKVDEGIEVFRAQSGMRPDLLTDLLTARQEFQEALDLVKQAQAQVDRVDARMGLAYKFRQGRLLAQLGEVERAGQIFEQAKGMLRSRDQYLIVQLLRDEVKAGRYDLADAHAGYFLDLIEKADDGFYATPSPFETLFEDNAESARGCWRALRKYGTPKELPAETMKRVRELLTGKATAPRMADFHRAVDLFEDTVKRADYPNPNELLLIGQARAAVARVSGKLEEAEKAYSAAATAAGEAAMQEVEEEDRRQTGPRAWVFGTDERFRCWLDFGDFLNEKGRFKDAAAKYFEGWKQFPDNPILLYLSGRALISAGDAEEGERRIRVSHWVPLGNARMRGRFLSELSSRGRVADLRRERDLTLKCLWYWEAGRGNVWNVVARASSLLKDYDKAADSTERYLNFIMRSENVYFVDGVAYAAVPMSVTAFEARSQLAAGKIDEAVRLCQQHRSTLPGSLDLTNALVPELDRLGQQAVSETLFRPLWENYQKLLQQYPNSGWVHGSLAALSAGCQRELDSGLQHARKAVELEPHIKSHRETLAEVHFRKGERSEALKIMNELLKTDWRNRVYRRQIERFEHGKPNSPIPSGPEHE